MFCEYFKMLQLKYYVYIHIKRCVHQPLHTRSCRVHSAVKLLIQVSYFYIYFVTLEVYLLRGFICTIALLGLNWIFCQIRSKYTFVVSNFTTPTSWSRFTWFYSGYKLQVIHLLSSTRHWISHPYKEGRCPFIKAHC